MNTAKQTAFEVTQSRNGNRFLVATSAAGKTTTVWIGYRPSDLKWQADEIKWAAECAIEQLVSK